MKMISICHRFCLYIVLFCALQTQLRSKTSLFVYVLVTHVFVCVFGCVCIGGAHPRGAHRGRRPVCSEGCLPPAGGGSAGPHSWAAGRVEPPPRSPPDAERYAPSYDTHTPASTPWTPIFIIKHFCTFLISRRTHLFISQSLEFVLIPSKRFLNSETGEGGRVERERETERETEINEPAHSEGRRET